MRYLSVILICWMTLYMSACDPFTAAGMVGSTVVRAVGSERQRQAKAAPERLAVAMANVNLGIEYMRQGEYEKALEKLERAKLAEPEYAPVYNMSGVLYQTLGETEKAEENFKKSLRLDDANSDLLNNYGQFLCAEGRDDEALDRFLMAAVNPLYRSPEIPYVNAGMCAQMHERNREAEGYFLKALNFNPRFPSALIQMSEIEYNKTNYQKAHHYLAKYLEVARHTPKSLWLGIRIEKELGNKDALSSYALLLKIEFPDAEETRLLEESGLR